MRYVVCKVCGEEIHAYLNNREYGVKDGTDLVVCQDCELKEEIANEQV